MVGRRGSIICVIFAKPFNYSNRMSRWGRHVQRALVSSSIGNGLPPPMTQLTHTPSPSTRGSETATQRPVYTATTRCHGHSPRYCYCYPGVPSHAPHPRRIVASINYYPNYIYANQRLELLAIYYLTPLYPLQPTLRSGNLPSPSTRGSETATQRPGVYTATTGHSPCYCYCYPGVPSHATHP